ncbi:MBL fold metallo-hydrolase [Isosphaeraceae bacterium EP7]
MPVEFCVLGSGSRGNSSLIRTDGAGLLIDVGLGPRALAARMASVGAAWGSVAAVVLTHTHGDHVNNATLRWMARLGICLYVHEGHGPQLAWSSGFKALLAAEKVRWYGDEPFLVPSGARVDPVTLRHDAGPTYGFRVEVHGGRRGRPAAIGFLSDTGSWSDPMADAMADVDLLALEFNHDVKLQRTSGRSPSLIARVLGEHGHLSNEQGAALLASVLGRSGRASVRDVVLLHLSEQCNEPALALRAARKAARASGRRVNLYAAAQWTASDRIEVKPARPTPRASVARPASDMPAWFADWR